MTIHREGYGTLVKLFIILSFLVAAALWYFPGNTAVHITVIVPSIIVYLFVLQFFRNPTRLVEKNEKHVIAPADGRVVVIENTVENEYFNDERQQISIFMSPRNVHCNRSPMEGEVSYTKYHPGKYYLAINPKSSTDNERNTVVFKNKQGIEVLCRQIAGAMARRIRWYVEPTNTIQQGEEFGFIKFGSRVDVFVPLDAKINVNLEETTKGGVTVLATLP